MSRNTNTETAGRIALLAPVPSHHLLSAKKVVEAYEMVAFGSNKFEVFRKLDKESNGGSADVYIYASHADGSFDPKVSWIARYRGSGEKCDPKLRPESTISDSPFGIYWIVDELREVELQQCLRVADLRGFGKNKPYGSKFVPEGPVLIDHP
jgi:hypothetical protein